MSPSFAPYKMLDPNVSNFDEGQSICSWRDSCTHFLAAFSCSSVILMDRNDATTASSTCCRIVHVCVTLQRANQ